MPIGTAIGTVARETVTEKVLGGTSDRNLNQGEKSQFICKEYLRIQFASVVPGTHEFVAHMNMKYERVSVD